MTRRCSHCSFDGHNSRTCPTRASSSAAGGGSGGGVRLFGVRLTDGSIMKKSASMGNLSSLAHYNSSTSTAASPNPSSPDTIGNAVVATDGYLSDDPAQVNRRTDRKKGTPWTEEEHRMFLIGLQKLGKGDWRGIARNYVITRTPTQVASHAQKYYIRHSNVNRRKRRTSLFDMTPDMETDAPPGPERLLLPEISESNHDKSEVLATHDQESQPMEVTCAEAVKEYDSTSVQASYIIPVPVPVVPAFYPAYLPVPFRFWSPNLAPTEEENPPESSSHQVLKPIPVIRRDPINVDELVGMSHLSIKETERSYADSNHLSQRLLGSPSRQSAFRPRRSASVPNLTQLNSQQNQAE